MRASATIAQRGGHALHFLGAERGFGVAGRNGRKAQRLNLIKSGPGRIAHADHSFAPTTGDVSSIPGHSSANSNNTVHVTTPSLVGPTYERRMELSFRANRTIVQSLPDDTVAKVIGEAIWNKPRKIISRMADACERTVNEWCLGRRLPNAAALIRLMRHDDEVFLAVIEMAGRAPPPALTERQRKAVAEALAILGGE